MATQKQIIGIKVAIENPDTGVPTNLHVISALNINYKTNSTMVTLDGYYSEKTFNLGKSSIGLPLNITVQGAPVGEEATNWAYRALVALVPEGAVDVYGNLIVPNAVTGAELVERDIA